MIGCDKCDEWYHFDCVGLDITQIPNIDTYEFVCPECCKKSQKTSAGKKTLGNGLNKRNAKAQAKSNGKLDFEMGGNGNQIRISN